MTLGNLTIGSIAYIYQDNSAVAIKPLAFYVKMFCNTMNHSIVVEMLYLSARDGGKHIRRLCNYDTDIYANISGNGTLADKYDTDIESCVNKNISLSAKNNVGQIFYHAGGDYSYDRTGILRYMWINNTPKLCSFDGNRVGHIEITKECAELSAPDTCYKEEFGLMLRKSFPTRQECIDANNVSVYTFAD